MVRHAASATVRRRHQIERDAWLAWHIAALSRVKKMPRLTDLLKRDKPARTQTAAEQIEVLKGIFENRRKLSSSSGS